MENKKTENPEQNELQIQLMTETFLEKNNKKDNFGNNQQENSKQTQNNQSSQTEKVISNIATNDEENIFEVIKEQRIALRDNTIEERIINIKEDRIEEKEEEEFKLEELSNVGTILNIIGAMIFLPFTVMASLIVLGIPLLIANIFAITSNFAYRNGKGSRTKAGILGIFFGFIIGGVLVLAAKDQSVEKEK